MEVPPGFRLVRRPEEMRALAHPLREAILARLRGREASAADLARELGESAVRVHHHLRPLVRFGFVRPVRTVRHGRARTTLYTAEADPWPGRELFPPGGEGVAWARLERGVRELVEDMARALERARREGPGAGEAEVTTTLWVREETARRLPALLATLARVLEAAADGPEAEGAEVYRIALLSWRKER